MSDVHSDWKDYGCSNYTVCARIDCVRANETATVGQMENSFEAVTDLDTAREEGVEFRSQLEMTITRCES